MPSTVEPKDNSRLESLRKNAVDTLKAVPGAMGAVLLALVFVPFRIPTSIPAALLICVSIAIGIYAWTKKTITWKIAVGTASLALLGVIWATLGIFVLSTSPVYCILGDEVGSLRSGQLISLGADGKLGVLFYITDPVRSSEAVRGLAKKINPKLVFLQTETRGSQSYMFVPLTGSVQHSVLDTSQNGGLREVIFPYVGPTLSIRTEPSYNPDSVTVALASRHVTLVSFIDRADDWGPEKWSAVAYPGDAKLRIACYVANLDLGLAAASEGKFDDAISGLETSFEFAPSGIEKARSRVLLGAVAKAALDGNIGEAQSLTYSWDAWRFWPLAAQGNREGIRASELSSTLDRWLYESFRGIYDRRREQFPVIARVLAFDAVPVNFSVQLRPFGRAPFDDCDSEHVHLDPVSALMSAENKKLLDIVRSNADPNALKNSLTAVFGWTNETKRWAGEAVASLNPCYGVHEATIDWVIDEMPEPWRAEYGLFRRSLKLFYATSPIVTVNGSGSSYADKRSLVLISQMADMFGFVLFSREFKGAASDPADKNPVFANPGARPTVPWWDREFLDWFGSKSAFIVMSDDIGSCAENDVMCGDKLNSYASEVVQDGRTNRLYFVPGIALILSTASITKLPVDNLWSGLYKEMVGTEFLTNEVQISEILFKYGPSGKASSLNAVALAPATKKADRALKLIQSGRNFDDVAGLMSERIGNDDLGYFQRGGLSKEIADIVFGMNKGDVSWPIRTKQGLVIFKLTDRRQIVSH